MNKPYRNEGILKEVEGYADSFMKLKASNKYRDHFFPAMIDVMNYKTAVEIGTNTGDYAYHLLNKSKIKKLYCVDTWQNDFGSDGYCDKSGDARMAQCQDKLKEFIDAGRCVLVRNDSVSASKEVPDDLDFVYIDGDHSLAMLLDLYVWVPKVVTSGIVGGHDMKNGPKSGITDYFGQQLDYEVEKCVDYFCRRFGFKYHTIGGMIKNFYFVKI